MHINFFIERFSEVPDQTAIVWKDKNYSYQWLKEKIDFWMEWLTQNNIKSGSVTALTADFSPNGIALLLAMIQKQIIIAPFTNTSRIDPSQKYEIAQVENFISIDPNNDDEVSFIKKDSLSSHDFYSTLKERNVPGLIMFTSGTSGIPKGAVHDFSLLLNKFRKRRKAIRTVNFLLFDHWGGLNTLFHTLSNTGIVLATKDRSPDGICSYIEKHKIELLPASPTFFNLLLMSEAYKRHDISSIKLMTYGTEPMPESTLSRLKQIFPNIKLQQTYGLIELGVLRSKSEDDKSLWVKIGGEGFDTRVVNGMLEIKAESAMLGYLNAPSPFTEDGWFMTGDAVEVKGDYFKILGRKSEQINVGGEKVYPAEVEGVIQEMDNIVEAQIYKEKNPITGNIVCVKVTLAEPEDRRELTRRIKSYCKERLQSFKIPVKVTVSDGEQFGERYKKVRH